MSITSKSYKFILNIKNIVERKSFKTLMIFFLAVMLFFGTFNSYAADTTENTQEESLTVSPAWEETKWFHNLTNGLGNDKKDQDNMNSRQGTEFLNSAWTVFSLLAPELTEVKGVQSEIPYDLQRGLIGITDDTGTAIYAAYPMVNVPNHLAQQWVPGYKDSTTSLYAAHDSGYKVLVGLWSKTLNIAYLAFVIIMIVSGFMIMFRNKIGGQTMVTIGNVLPRVIVALIIATFSFAIAGIIIDIGGIIISVSAFILGDGANLGSISGLPSIFGSALGQEEVGPLVVVKGVVESFGLNGILREMQSGSTLGLIATVIAVVSALNPLVHAQVGVITLIILNIIIIIIFVGAVKVLIALFKAYFSLLLSVILGPLQITMGAMPGNDHMIKNWFNSILKNVLVFPVVFFIINIPNALIAADAELNLRFPGKLVYGDPLTYSTKDLDVGTISIAVLRVFVLFFAAQAPKFLESWFPTKQPEGISEGIKGVQVNLQKIPIIGSLFKS